MKIASKDIDNYTIISVEGSLSMENSADFEESLSRSLGKEMNVVLNFSEVRFIDSTSIGILVLYYTKLKKIDKKLVILSAKADITQMFNLTGVSKQINCVKTIDAAITLLDE